MRKILTLILALALSFTMTGCASNTAETNKTSDTEAKAIENKQEEPETVEVNKKIINVEVTLPASFLGLDEEEVDIDQVIKDAKEQGIKDIIVNDDESVTYIMSKSKHKEMMAEMQEDIIETIDDLILDEDFTFFQDVVANKDFTEFDVEVIRDEYENSFDGFGILGLAFNSLFYQLFDGANPDNYRAVFNIKDVETGEVFETIVYPDAFE